MLGKSLSEFADFEPFEVDVLHPGRRLPEKLVHIHALAQQFGTDAPRPADARSGRHFNDVFQPLGDDHVLDLLADPNPGFSWGLAAGVACLNREVLLNWDDKGCRDPYRCRFEEHFLHERYRMVTRS